MTDKIIKLKILIAIVAFSKHIFKKHVIKVDDGKGSRSGAPSSQQPTKTEKSKELKQQPQANVGNKTGVSVTFCQNPP